MLELFGIQIKELLEINSKNIISFFILLLFFILLNLFETTFCHKNIIEKELFKEENENNKRKVKKFLTNILKYKILINVLNICIYFLFFFNILGAVLVLKNRFLFVLIFFIFLLMMQTIVKIFSKISIYKTLLNTFDYINTFYIILYPLIFLLYNIYKSINGIINNGNEIENMNLGEEDIKIIINSDKTKDVELEEKEMIHSIFSFTDTTVREIMTPRTSIVAFDKNEKLVDVIPEIIECEFSRIPIYSESIDDIIGIINIKDMLKYIGDKNSELKLEHFVKKVIYIPETKNLIEMLEYFRKNQQHMAIIIDEYGGTLGLITIEDLLEEIVGEIRDEYDIEEDNFKKISSNVFEILGETLVEDINSEYNIDIELSEEYDTVSGYIQYNLGKVAEINDRVVNEKYIIQVLEINNKRIEKVKLIIKN